MVDAVGRAVIGIIVGSIEPLHLLIFIWAIGNVLILQVARGTAAWKVHVYVGLGIYVLLKFWQELIAVPGLEFLVVFTRERFRL